MIQGRKLLEQGLTQLNIQFTDKQIEQLMKYYDLLIQRKMSESISVVMDGRDIGTYVLPNADIKIFQVASVGTRALRRYKENISKGIQCELEDIEIGLKKRDHIDSTRTFAPLKPADDSIVLDTSNLSIEEAVDAVIEIIKKKGYEVKNG